MADRRRSRKGPLTESADRSPLHAIAVWLFKSSLIAVLFLGVWLLVSNWAVPSLVEGFLP